MDKKKTLGSFLRILETAAYIVSLIFAMRLLGTFPFAYDDSFLMVYVFSTLAYALSSAGVYKKDRVSFIKFICWSGIFLIMTTILLLFRESESVNTYVLLTYIILSVLLHVVMIILKRSTVRSITDIVIILLWLAVGVFLLIVEDGLIFFFTSFILCFALPAQMLIRITRLSFSHFRFEVLIKVMRKSMAFEILSGLAVLIGCFSYAFTYLEESMKSYSDALWYCFAIVTTIGFGDITAVSAAGRVLSVILGIYGIIVVALITSIIVNFYNEVKDTSDLKKNDDTDEKK